MKHFSRVEQIGYLMYLSAANIVKDISIDTDRSQQIVQIQVRLLHKEQSDQGLHCLLFHFLPHCVCPKINIFFNKLKG